MFTSCAPASQSQGQRSIMPHKVTTKSRDFHVPCPRRMKAGPQFVHASMLQYSGTSIYRWGRGALNGSLGGGVLQRPSNPDPV